MPPPKRRYAGAQDPKDGSAKGETTDGKGLKVYTHEISLSAQCHSIPPAKSCREGVSYLSSSPRTMRVKLLTEMFPTSWFLSTFKASALDAQAVPCGSCGTMSACLGPNSFPSSCQLPAQGLAVFSFTLIEQRHKPSGFGLYHHQYKGLW